MISEYNKIDLKEYKGALIQYTCEECVVNEKFFEVFDNQTSRIKSGCCSHFNVTFIYNYEEEKLKYKISYNCNNCNQKEMFNLFDENSTEDTSYKEIKCKKCNEGSMYILLLLSKDGKNEEIKDVNNIENKIIDKSDIEDSNKRININGSSLLNQCIKGGRPDQHKQIMNNASKEKIYSTPEEINLSFRDIKGNSYDLYISSNTFLSKALRILMNKYKKIDIERISCFYFKDQKLDVKKTLMENNLKNNSIITIHYDYD